MKKNKLELTDKEYDALRALLYQTTTYEVFMEAHLELFPETYKTLKEINKILNPMITHLGPMVLKKKAMVL